MKNKLNDMGKHILTGIKFAVPALVIYSVMLALVSTNLIKSENFDISHYFYLLIIPILTAFIANSICDKIVFIPGLILGYYFEQWGLGFFGGIIGGLVLGYTARFISEKVRCNNNVICIVVGYIVIGGLSFTATYFLLLYFVSPVILTVLNGINNYIVNIKTTEVILLVGVLALLTTIDLGGPFNKLAYSFYIGFYLEGFYHLSGPVLISTAIPPISIFIALKLYPKRFNDDDHKAKRIALFGSLTGLTEGALIVAFRRPLKIIPVLVLGSVFAAVFAAYFELENRLLLASVLGLFGVNNLFVYILAHMFGVGIVLVLFFLVLPKDEKNVVE